MYITKRKISQFYSSNLASFQPASSADIWRWVHSVYGDELGLTSEDEPDYVSPFLTPEGSDPTSKVGSVNCSPPSSKKGTPGKEIQNNSQWARKFCKKTREIIYQKSISLIFAQKSFTENGKNTPKKIREIDIFLP